MSAPVDVLAVMELAYRHLNGGTDSLSTAEFVAAHAGMKEARAAVADLIEAAGKLRADIFLWRLTGNVPNLQMLANDEEALDAALARVKGGAA